MWLWWKWLQIIHFSRSFLFVFSSVFVCGVCIMRWHALDGGKVIEAAIPRRFTLPASTIGRATYVHIYVLPPAVWDDRINVTSVCWRSPRQLSNDRPKCKQQSIPSILYDHRDYEWWWIRCNNTHTTETCFGIWRKSTQRRQFHQTKILIRIKHWWTLINSSDSVNFKCYRIVEPPNGYSVLY